MSWTAHRSCLLAAASCLSLSFATAAIANDDEIGTIGYGPIEGIDISGSVMPGSVFTSFDGEVAIDGVENVPGVVGREEFDPNLPPPDGILDPVNINGIGQMVTDFGAAGLGTCTGTLINPRTVIFAAHCVNDQAAEAYGAATGGTPMSFGFQQNNIPGLLNWLGINDPSRIHQTDIATAIYNVEHLWYDPRSLEDPLGLGFIEADVAIATLDTPAFDIPTWALLFSPLSGPADVIVTGYGRTSTDPTLGDNVSGGFRRRAAENVVDFLGSFDDRGRLLFEEVLGFPPSDPLFVQSLYQTDFDSPDGADPFDFDIFDGVAREREGTTGGGDSGGPLIIQNAFDQQVVAGVLSGGSRFFGAGGNPFSSYGTVSFYQPLFLFWDTIVENNPYVYATNVRGVGEWTDANHWVQQMDPAYQVIRDGQLVNALPGERGAGVSDGGTTFGNVCFLDTCASDDVDGGEDAGTGAGLVIEGGPGSTGFVPNNVVGVPGEQRPRYYDVTLAAFGKTNLRGADIVIDRLTLDGLTKLDIKSDASLRALGDFNQFSGWTNVDGTLQTNEAFLMTGFLTGSGTLIAPFLTTAAVAVAPGGVGNFGTLTIDGNMIMASGSALFIDASRDGADMLSVTGFLSLSDPSDAASKGPTLVFNKSGRAPRHGQSFEIVNAAGGIQGTFGRIASFQGVLRPELTYGENSIIAKLRAGALVDIIGRKNKTARAFAAALDTLRDGSYDSLYNFYGMIDLMDGASLTATLSGLAPRMASAGMTLQQRQSRMLGNAVTDRLSVMGSDAGGSFAMVGAPETLRMGLSSLSGQRNVRMGIADLAPRGGNAMELPEGVSGFVSGGTYGAREAGSASLADGGQIGSYFGMGVEHRISSKASFGIAVGHADGRETADFAQSDARTTQVSAYGAYDLGSNAYVGGVASMDMVDLRSQRSGFDGLVDQRLNGATSMKRYAASAEIGINLAVAQGLTLTPRAQLGYDNLRLNGYEEQGSQVALAVDSLGTQSMTARGGFKLAGSHQMAGGWTLTPLVRADYVHRVMGSDNGLTVRFAAADHVGIALPLAEGEGSWGEVRAGLTLDNGTVTFGAGFETAIERRAIRDDRAMVEVGLRF